MNKQVLLLGLLFALLAASCGTPGYCREASFDKLYNDDWSPYCETFKEHVESAGNYTPSEITAFFASHQARVDDLNKRLDKVKDRGAACFPEKRDVLEYRRLNSCLTVDDEQQAEIGVAWGTVIDGWLNEHRLGVIAAKPKLKAATREGDRLIREAREAFEFKVTMDEGQYQKWADTVDALDTRVETNERLKDEWREIVDLGMDDEHLSSLMANEYGAKVAEFTFEVEKQRAQHDKLQAVRRYLTFALHSAGKLCQDRTIKKAGKEMKIAKKALKTQLKVVGGKKLQVTSKILPDQRESLEVEAFKGAFCGTRGKSNQFTGQPQQCGRYSYVIERTRALVEQPQPTPENPKPKRVRKPKWGAWKAVTVEEGNPTEGVDCGILNAK